MSDEEILQQIRDRFAAAAAHYAEAKAEIDQYRDELEREWMHDN